MSPSPADHHHLRAPGGGLRCGRPVLAGMVMFGDLGEARAAGFARLEICCACRRAIDGGRRILLVEDDGDSAEMLAELLTLEGHTVRVAHAAEQALLLARAFPFQVALVDLGLPLTSGYQLLPSLREAAGDRPARFVAVTGYADPAARERTRVAGFDAHVVKPIDLDALDELLAG
jgi:CheY-like chemotaxis protein